MRFFLFRIVWKSRINKAFRPSFSPEVPSRIRTQLSFVTGITWRWCSRGYGISNIDQPGVRHVSFRRERLKNDRIISVISNLIFNFILEELTEWDYLISSPTTLL